MRWWRRRKEAPEPALHVPTAEERRAYREKLIAQRKAKEIASLRYGLAQALREAGCDVYEIHHLTGVGLPW